MADNWQDLDPAELGHVHMAIVIGCLAGSTCTGGEGEPLAVAVTGPQDDRVPPGALVAMVEHAGASLRDAYTAAGAAAAAAHDRRN